MFAFCFSNTFLGTEYIRLLTYFRESQIKSALLLHKPAILSKPKCTLDIVKKRRLFDIDQTVVFEKDDSNVNQDKSTNTDNVEINCEANKRKTVSNEKKCIVDCHYFIFWIRDI